MGIISFQNMNERYRLYHISSALVILVIECPTYKISEFRSTQTET